ncbi:unnamed protein product [Rotaria sp. Silwood2]|nr:unnamed protein product [Rotaria sp. Silwood2]
MKLAKVFDPTCQRQLIAASKIDKYDKGIAEKLQGRGFGSMDLQLGCVAVINRNQDEIDQNISFDEMKQRERQFFIKHKEAFQHLPDEFKGSEQLVRRLATIQQERIRSTFPDIIKELKKQINEKKTQLKKIPPAMDTETKCWTSFQSMINAYREKRVQETLAMERRVFTLNHYYMDTVNKFKDREQKKKDERGGSSATSSSTSLDPKVPITTVTNDSTSTVAYTSVSNEVQAAMDIQIALHAYSKVVEKRMTDNIAQTCYYHFITECALKMDQALSISITSSQLAQYMREPYKQANLRNKLTHSIQACEEALQLGLTHM